MILAVPQGDQILAQAKAYLNPFGTSVIILSRPIEKMDDHSMFFLYHEFAHITVHGDVQLTEAHFGQIWRLTTLIVFSCWISAWWQLPVALAYGIYIWTTWYVQSAVNEAFADVFALHQFQDKETRLRLINDLRELFQPSVLRGSKKSRIIANTRLYFINSAQTLIARNQGLKVYASAWLVEFIFAVLFLAWPLTSPAVPLAFVAGTINYILRAEYMRWRSIIFRLEAEARLKKGLDRIASSMSNPSSTSRGMV